MNALYPQNQLHHIERAVLYSQMFPQVSVGLAFSCVLCGFH